MTDATDKVTVRSVLETRGQWASDVVAARLDGAVVDVHTPVAPDASVAPLRIGQAGALDVIRHSTAHVMADAVQRLFPGTQVTFGPSTDNGFYYDFDRPAGQFSDEELQQIEATMREIIAKDAPFRREVIEKADAAALFAKMGEKYKVEHIDRLNGEITLYRHGDWVDLCAGPHVPSTGYLRAVKLTSVAGAYWRGDERNPMLQRIYGTAFPSEKELRKYLADLEEAKKRDHRKLGKELELFSFHPLAPASPFVLPRGAAVYNRLVEYIRSLYAEEGYDEVITPQVFETALFETSGHFPHYAANMFLVGTDDGLEQAAANITKHPTADPAQTHVNVRAGLRYALKSMNCPGHCVMFGMTRRSYRELPMRIADFGRLHRYERSGVTQGLTRVRTFAQDDAHIFCTLDQMQAEIGAFLGLVYRVYADFVFSDVRVVIATRPAERLGSDEVWDRSEAALKDAVAAKKVPVEIAEGEGAFYGPKIEFHVRDALGRPWQLGTIQVDFNLPDRFDLNYVGSDNTTHRPVMLHRAILGSVERFMGVLIEHVGGAFPTWLAPEQIAILTVSDKVDDYANEVIALLRRAGIRVVSDLSDDKLGAKIRKARNMRYPYLAVVGAKEAEQRGLSVRSRDLGEELGFIPLNDMIERIRAEGIPPSRRSG